METLLHNPNNLMDKEPAMKRGFANEVLRPVACRPVARTLAEQAGITLLFTLGFLSVMLVMMLSLAMLSRSERHSASLSNDAVRTRLIAETAMERALAELRVGCKGEVFPADTFLVPEDDSDWDGRLLATRDASGTKGDLKAGVDEAMASSVLGREITPGEAPSNKVTWVPVLSTVTVDGVTSKAIIGRYVYALMDQTGHIDPAAVVRRDQSEQSDLAVRTGYALTDVTLGDLGFVEPDRFNYGDADYPGKLPEVGRWFSLAHMIKNLNLTQDEVDLANRTLSPFSHDTEVFWRDRNGNGVWDAGEDSPRLNIVAETDPSVLYQLFVGAVQDFSANDNGVDAGADDCAWLKELSDSAWFQVWKNRVFAAYSEPERTIRARASVAAQVAVNIVDYADPDSQPTSAYLGNDGQIHLGSSPSSLTLQGIENNWGISEVSMRVQADVVGETTGGTDAGDTQNGDATEDIEFTIVNGQVIPASTYEASVTVLGVQLGMYDTSRNPPLFISWCGVTADLNVGGDNLQPWGDYTNCYNNNLNDGNNPRNFDIPGSYPAGTPITVRSRYYYHPCSYNKKTGTYTVSSSWTYFESLTSDGDRDQVKVLRDGDEVPSITTVSNQNEAAYYLEDYIEDGKISLQPNQAIFLFETNPATASQDFQDLVVLVTLRPSDDETVPEMTTLFQVNGLANINPNNNGVDEFYLTKPDGSQITRDDLHAWGDDYTGPANWVHIRPKGNANQNTFSLSGDIYEMKNGTTYDFAGAMNVHLYNDHRDANGRAMGDWWIGTEGQSVMVVKDGQAYVLAPEEGSSTSTTTTTTDTSTIDLSTLDGEPIPGSTGNHLRVRAGFQVELFYPFGEYAQVEYAPSGVTVQYTIQVSTANGKSLNYTGTVDLLPSEAANADGGTLLWTTDYVNDEWQLILDAFMQDQDPPLNSYVITMARIDSVVVRDRLGDVVDRVPSSNGPLCGWSAGSAKQADQDFFADTASYDALMNDRGQDWADFDMFWDVRPVDRTLAEADSSEVTGIGEIAAGYNSSPYSGIGAKNAPIERLGELGRVHSYMPQRSLRLWSATSGDTAGHDAAILDLFKVGNAVQTRGKININSLQPEVLTALFKDCTTVPTSQAVSALLDYRASHGAFSNIGEAFGAIASLTGSNPALDAVEENTVAALAEKVTVRQNYYRILVCAQAIKDVKGLPYRDKDGVLTTAALGKMDVAYNSSGEMLRYVDKILAEEKLMAVVYRDAFSGELRVDHVELLNE